VGSEVVCGVLFAGFVRRRREVDIHNLGFGLVLLARFLAV